MNQRLIWEHQSTDGFTYSCTDSIPFEHTSKEDFVLEILNECEKARKNGETTLTILGVDYVPIEEAECIEHQVKTLDDWFEANKQR